MLAELLAAAAVSSQPVLLAGKDVEWTALPSAENFTRYYPEEAFRHEVSGRVTLSCTVTAAGRMGVCLVSAEDPVAMHFGDAALKMATSFRMKPVKNRAPNTVYLVNVPIRFTFPEANRTYAGANTIARPRWAQAPTYADVLTAYPSGLALDGRITFDCRVQPEGTLGDCRPVSERNQGAVERSARTLLSRFRLLLDPAWDPKGRPIRVNVPIRLVDPTSPQAATRALSGPPPWVAMPSAQMLASAYPREAREKGLATGRGVIDCEVAADGALANCSAASATPEGAGFAEAALRVAKELRLNLWTSEGGPVVGARIRLPISFEAETTPPKP